MTYYRFNKYADYNSDYLRSLPGEVIGNKIVPGVGGFADWVGSIDGLTSDANIDTIKDFEKNPGLAYLPGVNGYRRAKRLVTVEDALNKKKKSKKHSISEILGPTTSTLLATALGGAIGNKFEFNNGHEKRTRALEGALIGALLGGGSHVLGSGIGALSKKRSKEEQEEHYNSSPILNYLIPGLAGYNRNKALQLSDDLITTKSKKKS